MANAAGTWTIAFAVVHSHVFEPRVWDALVQIGDRTVDASFPITLGKGIAAGWLIALMMWLLQAPDSSRVHIIIIMTYVLAICEFSHNVAGALDCAFMAQIGHVSLRDYVIVFFVPTLSETSWVARLWWRFCITARSQQKFKNLERGPELASIAARCHYPAFIVPLCRSPCSVSLRERDC